MNLEPSGFLEKVGKYMSNSRYTSGFPSCKAIWAQASRFGSARRSGHDGILNSALLFNKCFRVHRRSLMLKFLTMLTAFTWKRTSPGNLKKKNCGTACSASRLAKTRTYDSFCVRFLVSVDPLLFLFQASKSTGINFFLVGDLKSDGGGGLFFRLEFRRRTRRKIGLLPIVTSLWKNKYTLMLLQGAMLQCCLLPPLVQLAELTSSPGNYLETPNNCTVQYRSALSFLFLFLFFQSFILDLVTHRSNVTQWWSFQVYVVLLTKSLSGVLLLFFRNGPWSCLKGTFIALHSVDHVLINDCPSILYDGLYWTC